MTLSHDARATSPDVATGVLHDMKMPLQLQMNYIRIIEAKLQNLSPEAGAAVGHELEAMMDNSYRLLRLVDNLVSVSRADKQAMVLNATRFDLAGDLRALCDMAQSYAARSHIRLVYQADRETLMLTADREKVERMVLNLISNALKYTPANGHVGISLLCGDQRAAILVEDTGCGICAEQIDQLFEPYATTENDTLRGTGLGLFVVRAMARLHGGDVSVQSEPGTGSRFTIDLPLVDADAPMGYTLPGFIEERVRVELT